MTRYEIAQEVAKKMQTVRNGIDIERTARKLAKGMTLNELQKAYTAMTK